jgi:hypothetical protein
MDPDYCTNPLSSLSHEKALQRQFYFANAYRKPPMILKSIPEAGYDTYTGENRPIAEKQTKIDQWQKREDGQKI